MSERANERTETSSSSSSGWNVIGNAKEKIDHKTKIKFPYIHQNRLKTIELLVGWSVGRTVDRMSGRLFDWLMHRLVDWLVGWLDGWLLGRLGGQIKLHTVSSFLICWKQFGKRESECGTRDTSIFNFFNIPWFVSSFRSSSVCVGCATVVPGADWWETGVDVDVGVVSSIHASQCAPLSMAFLTMRVYVMLAFTTFCVANVRCVQFESKRNRISLVCTQHSSIEQHEPWSMEYRKALSIEHTKWKT